MNVCSCEYALCRFDSAKAVNAGAPVYSSRIPGGYETSDIVTKLVSKTQPTHKRLTIFHMPHGQLSWSHTCWLSLVICLLYKCELMRPQVFVASKDGMVQIPLLITSRKNITLDGNNPTILHGYGGKFFQGTPP